MYMNRTEALQAAVGVFLQYGYRKSSMEDIARAIGVSRQWVYQQFESKEKLFHDAVESALEGMLAKSRSVLAEDKPIDALLLAAFDAWCGEHLETFSRSPHADEIMASAYSQFGQQIRATRDALEDALAEAIESAGVELPGTIQPNDVAALLLAASDGLKKYHPTRDEYLEDMRRFIQVVLAGR